MKIKKTESTLVEFDNFDVIGIKDIQTKELNIYFQHKNYGNANHIVGFETESTPEEEIIRLINNNYIFESIINDCTYNLDLIENIVNNCNNYPFDLNPIGEEIEILENTNAEILQILTKK